METYVITHSGEYAWNWNPPNTRRKADIQFASPEEADQFAARTDIKVIDDRKVSGPTNVWD
jgi:hypothetical protein